MSGCVLDTDVVIAALDRADAHHRAAAELIGRLAREDTPILLSLINYAETLVRPADDESTFRAAIVAMRSLGIRLVAPTPAIARDAARLRRLNISLADGFALATARAHEAFLASFDKRVRRALEPAGVALLPGH